MRMEDLPQGLDLNELIPALFECYEVARRKAYNTVNGSPEERAAVRKVEELMTEAMGDDE